MEKILQTHEFGPHRVGVLERDDDDGAASYLVLVDDVIVTDPPLPAPPRFEDVVRIYARSRLPQWRAADRSVARPAGYGCSRRLCHPDGGDGLTVGRLCR